MIRVDGTKLDSVRTLIIRVVAVLMAVPSMGSRRTVMVRMLVAVWVLAGVNMCVRMASLARVFGNACTTSAFGTDACPRTITRGAAPVVMPASRHRRCHQIGNEHDACCQVLKGWGNHDDQMLLQLS